MLEDALRVRLGPHMEHISDPVLRKSFFAPLSDALASSLHQRDCPSFTDAEFLELGVTRVICDPRSGRGFLQQIGAHIQSCPQRSSFFEQLKSVRRLQMLSDVTERVATMVSTRAELPEELADHDIYAGDGHWHGAAAHDSIVDDKRWAVGHVYALNLRTRALHHLDLTQGKKEHDMSVLKRLGADTLRMGAKKRHRVIWVWDRAGIDFELWRNWKNTRGIYFISRTKDNMAFTTASPMPRDPDRPVDPNILSDERCLSGQGTEVRLIRYRDPVSATVYEFVTTVFHLPADIIAWLYKSRWNIEKVFDQLKNKFDESKAWATSDTAKSIQAKFLCLAHNLLQLFEVQLETEHHIRNEAGLLRREKRAAEYTAAAKEKGHVLSSLLTRLFQPLQRSIKLIRWLRSHWFSSDPLSRILPDLARSYAHS